MASTAAYKEIGVFVDDFIQKYKLSDEDYWVFLHHACDCLRELNTRHNNRAITVKVSVSPLGIIEMPRDMIGFGWVAIARNGEWVTFTKKSRKVTTTTIVNNVETLDANFGEGVDVKDDMYTGIAGRGGVNNYYFNIDWTTKRLTIDGMKSDTAILRYTSNGLIEGGSTFVPSDSGVVIERYMYWKLAEIKPESMSTIQYRERQYSDELQKLRIATWMPSLDEIKDVWDANSTVGVQR